MHVKEIILKAEPEVIHVRLIAWCNGYKQHKSWKKDISKEVVPVAWHPPREWDWCMPED